MSQRKIVIFGAGIKGEKFVYQYFNEIDIYCFWDNKKKGEILGYSIEKPKFYKNYFIIVASDFYFEIREQLIQIGYREFYDFIPAQIFNKKIAIVYGNCHIDAVKNYLQCHKKFDLEYGFYPFPMIQMIKNMNLEYSNILCHCDLFLHQSIRKNNVYGEFYSSEQMLQYVKKTCKIISIPNLYGLPKYLFPQLNTINVRRPGSFCPFFIDANIVSWLGNGKNCEEISNYILNGGVYSKTEILDMWENFQLKIYEREKEWDIKISNYILENNKKEKLFCDINHITSKTAKEIAMNILNYMGYREKINIELPIMDDMETVIYRDVKEALGLEFEDKIIRKYSMGRSSFNCCEMNIKEYIEQLIQFTKYCLSIKKK